MATRQAKVCVLSGGEAQDLRIYGISPDCKLHKHVFPAIAFDMTRLKGLAESPVAQWVGPRQIEVTVELNWRGMNSAGFKVMELVPA